MIKTITHKPLRKAIAAAVFLSLLLSACQTAERPKKEPGQSSEVESTSLSTPASQAQTPQFEADSLYGDYFKAGDFAYRMGITPGEVSQRDILSVTVAKRDILNITYSNSSAEMEYGEWSNALTLMHEFHLPYMQDAALYDLSDVISGHDGSYVIEVYEDGSLSLRGDTDAAGRYYPYEGNLILPDALKRPLNATDLIGLDKEQMSLLRNEFYALYGRMFQTEKIKRYFEAQPWYKGTIPADQFNDGILGGMVRRNAAFLKAAEDAYDKEQAVSQQKTYDELKAAPYLDLLPEHGEVSVSIQADSYQSVDEGIFYRAKGTISVPIMITSIQYEALENGQEVEVIMDASAEETALLKKQPDSLYTLTPASPGVEAFWDYVMLSYEPYSGTFTISVNSADTLFMEVYEGDIYVLKGATEEYYRYFDMAGDRKEADGSYRVIDFDEEDADAPPYHGNMPVFDGKGYLKALNYWGD